MGRFETEIDLIQHFCLRESFRYAKLIVLYENEVDLKKISVELQKKIVEQEIFWYPNARQQIPEWIVVSCDLIDSIMVYDEIPLNDLPPVQLTSLYSDHIFFSIK